MCLVRSIPLFVLETQAMWAFMARWFGRLYPLLGLKVEHRFPQNKENMPRCIYIGNHQNNFDMVTISYMVLPRTVSVGKKPNLDSILRYFILGDGQYFLRS